MFRSPQYWKDRADEVRAIANLLQGEETRRMMAEIATDYDRLSEGAKALVTQKERNDEEANRRTRRQITESLISAPFSDARAKQAIDALTEAPFSHARVK
jgi:hypothetical protein